MEPSQRRSFHLVGIQNRSNASRRPQVSTEKPTSLPLSTPLRQRSPQTLRDAPLKSFATTARLKERIWTMNSIANKRELKTASSSYQRSQLTGDPQTKASRQMRRTKTGSGYSPGLRKTPHGAWKAGDIASTIRTKPKRTSSVSHTQSQWKTTIKATAYRTMES